MSRSAVDATRFTPTSPHAYTNPTPVHRAPPSAHSASSRLPPNPNIRFNPNARTPPPSVNPGKGNTPPAETPAEKVARLRQARLRERDAQATTWDKLVVRGRVWADTAHKITVVGIVGFSIVTTAVTGFALTDMIIHNRRKRAAYYAEQHALYAQRLIEAIQTEQAGLPLDDDLTLVMNRERARVQAEELARERSWRKSIKNLFIGGLKTDEEEATTAEGEGRAKFVEVPSEGEILQRLGVDQTKILERATMEADRQSGRTTTTTTTTSTQQPQQQEREEREENDPPPKNGSNILQAVAEKRREGEKTAGGSGGPLDRMADDALRAVGEKVHTVEQKVGSSSSSSSSSGGWTSWWSGK